MGGLPKTLRLVIVVVLLLATVYFSGVAVAATPDEIRIVASPSTVLSGGYETTITAQLYLGGFVLAESGIPWTGLSWSGGVLELVGTVPSESDRMGQFQFTLRSLNGVNGGSTVYMAILDGAVFGSVAVWVSGWGSITGNVLDTNLMGVGGDGR